MCLAHRPRTLVAFDGGFLKDQQRLATPSTSKREIFIFNLKTFVSHLTSLRLYVTNN